MTYFPSTVLISDFSDIEKRKHVFALLIQSNRYTFHFEYNERDRRERKRKKSLSAMIYDPFPSDR